ncbi:hypothetical protein C4573_05820 [Candidatus Woesearchaeota archaeon]|nr:MAG: hypothetical protein C4573_05820 [Candidatus Woesearchaeota archaeon]
MDAEQTRNALLKMNGPQLFRVYQKQPLWVRTHNDEGSILYKAGWDVGKDTLNYMIQVRTIDGTPKTASWAIYAGEKNPGSRVILIQDTDSLLALTLKGKYIPHGQLSLQELRQANAELSIAIPDTLDALLATYNRSPEPHFPPTGQPANERK